MRNSVEIEVWMKRNNLSVGKIQKELGYKTHTGVSNTIAGRDNLRRVLQLLVDKGCPVKYLDLPKNMGGQQK